MDTCPECIDKSAGEPRLFDEEGNDAPPVVDLRVEQAKALDAPIAEEVRVRRQAQDAARKKVWREADALLSQRVTKLPPEERGKFLRTFLQSARADPFLVLGMDDIDRIAENLGMRKGAVYNLLGRRRQWGYWDPADKLVYEAENRPVIVTVVKEDMEYYGPAEGGQYANTMEPIVEVKVHSRADVPDVVANLQREYSNAGRPEIHSVSSRGRYRIYVGYEPQPAVHAPPFGWYE